MALLKRGSLMNQTLKQEGFKVRHDNESRALGDLGTLAAIRNFGGGEYSRIHIFIDMSLIFCAARVLKYLVR